MLLDEHNSKTLFAEAGLTVPRGMIVRPGAAEGLLPEFPVPWYLKAQVLAGGRGKAGGIMRVDDPEDLPTCAQALFEKTIKGKPIPFLRLEEGAEAAKEVYLSFTVSREMDALVLTTGRQGGMDIESMGQDNLLVQAVPMNRGLAQHQVRAAFFHLGVDVSHWPGFRELVYKLDKAVRNYGLLLAEINPLVIDESGQWLALDGKIEVDDNLLCQKPELNRFYAPEHASREENVAREAGLSFHSLSGWVGLMVNGAGLAMATMDILNDNDLPAANFMDLGGTADLDRMRTALNLLFGDASVKAVFINIFGGVLSCEKVALALAEALEGNAPAKPLVVRLSGNQAGQAQRILAELALPGIHVVSEIDAALTVLRALRDGGDVPDMMNGETPAPASIVDFNPAPLPPELPFDTGAPVLVQGITGRVAQLHTRLMQEYGTNIVAGVTPFKGGQEVLGVPVYNSVQQACREHEISTSIIFVPGAFAADAMLEAAGQGIPWTVCITDGITQHDMLAVREVLSRSKTRLIGPNNPGLIAPGRSKIGIMPGHAFAQGPVAVLSRSGTLTYEVASRLTRAGIGQSLCVGIGGDPFVGTSFTDLFQLLREDENTRAVVVLGEIGGTAEEKLARYVIESGFDKPVTAFIAGRTAPAGKRLGHAGAILEAEGGIETKLDAMRKAGFSLCRDLDGLAAMVVGTLG